MSIEAKFMNDVKDDKIIVTKPLNMSKKIQGSKVSHIEEVIDKIKSITKNASSSSSIDNAVFKEPDTFNVSTINLNKSKRREECNVDGHDMHFLNKAVSDGITSENRN